MRKLIIIGWCALNIPKIDSSFMIRFLLKIPQSNCGRRTSQRGGGESIIYIFIILQGHAQRKRERERREYTVASSLSGTRGCW